jgi:hypothetical protein
MAIRGIIFLVAAVAFFVWISSHPTTTTSPSTETTPTTGKQRAEDLVTTETINIKRAIVCQTASATQHLMLGYDGDLRGNPIDARGRMNPLIEGKPRITIKDIPLKDSNCEMVENLTVKVNRETPHTCEYGPTHPPPCADGDKWYRFYIPGKENPAFGQNYPWYTVQIFIQFQK